MHLVTQGSSGCGHCGISGSPRGMGWVGAEAMAVKDEEDEPSGKSGKKKKRPRAR